MVVTEALDVLANVAMLMLLCVLLAAVTVVTVGTSGRLRGFFVRPVCPYCLGDGWRSRVRMCRQCKGSGRIRDLPRRAGWRNEMRDV